ncbi:MerR family transcriptional regulator [Isoptericola aurantiacus]|uniref:MerR family transcriptional regulator n=1 Tax=Isoptericola aurantiacus TaxID=3377839 RepID=UPI00383A2FB5
MKIGEVARRTGVAPRLIRYYEQQELLVAPRAANGYRDYGEEHVDRVAHVARLVRAGLSTRLVKALVEMEDAAAQDHPTCPRTVATLLAEALTGIDERISCLTRSRDTIRDFLERTEHAALVSEAAADPAASYSTPSSTSMARARKRSTGSSA